MLRSDCKKFKMDESLYYFRGYIWLLSWIFGCPCFKIGASSTCGPFMISFSFVDLSRRLRRLKRDNIICCVRFTRLLDVCMCTCMCLCENVGDV